MRTLLLFLAYYLVVTPAGLISRLVRDPMALRRLPGASSYWNPPTPNKAR